MIKSYKNFINEGLLKGKSKEDIAISMKNKSYDEIYYNVDTLLNSLINWDNDDTRKVDDIIKYGYELKLSAYDNVFLIELAGEDVMGGVNLMGYDICKNIKKENIIKSYTKVLKKYKKDYYDADNDYDDEIPNISDLETVYNIHDYVVSIYDSSNGVCVVYKIDGEVYVLDYDDKILKYAI